MLLLIVRTWRCTKPSGPERTELSAKKRFEESRVSSRTGLPVPSPIEGQGVSHGQSIAEDANKGDAQQYYWTDLYAR